MFQAILNLSAWLGLILLAIALVQLLFSSLFTTPLQDLPHDHSCQHDQQCPHRFNPFGGCNKCPHVKHTPRL